MLSSSFVFRAVTLGATVIWLSLAAANAAAQATRSYQMTNIPTTEGSSTVDIPIFHHSHTQPAGRSIIWLDPNLPNPIPLNVDWMRIVAAYVDEPYNNEIPENGHFGYCDSQAVDDKRDKLESMAATVRAKAPSARFWVNFRRTDIGFISAGCPLNQPYIDVISMDIYGVDFDSVLRGLYDTLYYSRATEHQQLALVPGTFTAGWQNQNGADGAARLAGFFDYAAEMNQYCGLQQPWPMISAPALGPMGRTGIYDECPVWMVAGWLGGTQPHRDEWQENGQIKYGPWHYPIDHPNSSAVAAAWQAEFAKRRVDPTRVRQAIKAAPLLFNETE